MHWVHLPLDINRTAPGLGLQHGIRTRGVRNLSENSTIEDSVMSDRTACR